MKNPILALLFVPFLVISCSKDTDDGMVIVKTVTISSAKIPCGPACTAEVWLLAADNNTFYEPTNLPESFKVPKLAVKVTLRKTGLKSNDLNGIGEERVEVLDIVKI
jgi:hypothetical protein